MRKNERISDEKFFQSASMKSVLQKQKLNTHFWGFLAIALCVLVGTYYCIQKSGMFIDEIYTYGLSNGYYTPFIRSLCDGNIVDSLIDQNALKEYLVVGEEGLSLGSVYYNQTMDVHPPLYYWLIHIVSAIFPGVFSKWIALIPNLLIFAATLMLLYKLSYCITHSETLSTFTVLLYGLSKGGLSTTLMIRMYVLLAFFTVLFAYLVVRFIQTEDLHYIPWIGIVIFLGLLTQYYFVYYAFFVCAAFVIISLIRKQYKSTILFSISALLGVAIFVCVYPACISHILGDGTVSGGSVVSNLTNFSIYKGRLFTFFIFVKDGLKIAFYLGIMATILLMLTPRSFFSKLKERKNDFYSGIICLAMTIPSFVMAAISSPYIVDRYLYNIYPIFVLAVGFVLSFCSFKKLRLNRIWGRLGITVCLAFALLTCLFQLPPDHLYLSHKQINETISEHCQYPCVYFDDNYNAPLTQDALQLVQFKDVFVTNRVDSTAMKDYLNSRKDAECVVVYIDVRSLVSNGYDYEQILSEFIENTAYNQYKLLYGFGLSQVYLVSK